MRFSLPAGSRRHEEVNPGNAGVDFEVALAPPVWLEVKNWNAPVIPENKRAEVRDDFVAKTDLASGFWSDIVAKFEGTQACLAARGESPPEARLLLLLEAEALSGMALAPAISILEALIDNCEPIKGFSVGLTGLARFSEFLPACSVERCSVLLNDQCAEPVDHCATNKRLRRQQVRPG